MEAAAHPFFHSPVPRQPDMVDAAIFFVGLPVAVALLFSLVGMPLIQGMPYLDGLYYMVCHMLLSWTSMSAGAWTARSLLRGWRPSGQVLCIAGYVLALVPAALLFHELRDVFAARYPVFALRNPGFGDPRLDAEFAFRFVRYSVPALFLFTAGVYGYRFFTGVDWLGYETRVGASAPAAAPAAAVPPRPRPLAARLPLVTVPPDAEVLAIKAEQHYVYAWTTAGRELVRYRFRDIGAAFAGCRGAQVHRSWWVNLDKVVATRRDGRTLELEIEGGLVVPVSHSQRGRILAMLGARGRESVPLVAPPGGPGGAPAN